jgi:hypothetical protein
MPGLLSDIVRHAVLAQTDMALVAAPRVRGLALGEADVVVVGLPTARQAEECSRLLYANPTAKVVAIGTDDGRASLYELTPQCVALGDLSPEGLVEAIRRAGGASRAR